MALISCPECKREISDKVNSCPHCGFPLKEEMIQEVHSNPQQVEVTNVKIKASEKTKKIAIISVISVVVIIGLFLVFKTYNEEQAYNTYIDNLKSANSTMLSGGAIAEELNNLIVSVWHKAIYEDRDTETDKYTHPNGHLVSDFNEALANLFSDSSTVETVIDIEINQEVVKLLMKDLQNPPEGLEQCYDTVTELYSSYKSYTNLATNPTGSYTSFTESVNAKSSDLLESYETLTNQIPDKF